MADIGQILGTAAATLTVSIVTWYIKDHIDSKKEKRKEVRQHLKDTHAGYVEFANARREVLRALTFLLAHKSEGQAYRWDEMQTRGALMMSKINARWAAEAQVYGAQSAERKQFQLEKNYELFQLLVEKVSLYDRAGDYLDIHDPHQQRADKRRYFKTQTMELVKLGESGPIPKDADEKINAANAEFDKWIATITDGLLAAKGVARPPTTSPDGKGVAQTVGANDRRPLPPKTLDYLPEPECP